MNFVYVRIIAYMLLVLWLCSVMYLAKCVYCQVKDEPKLSWNADAHEFYTVIMNGMLTLLSYLTL